MSVMLEYGPGAEREPAVRADRDARAPGEQVPQVVADELRAPAVECPHSGSGSPRLACADDLLELGARGDQLVREPGLERARAQQRLGERDQRRVAGLEALATGLARDRRRLRPARDRLEDRLAAALDSEGWMPRICPSARGWTAVAWRARPAPGRRSPSRRDGPRSTRSARARPRAPGRPRANAGRAGRRGAGAPRRSRGRARRSRPRAGGTPRAPTQPAAVAEAPLELVGQLDQVRDVLGCVAELLVGQRAGVPARVAGGLADPSAKDLSRAGCRSPTERRRRRTRRRSGCRTGS